MENGGPAEEAKMFHPIPDDYDGDGLSSVSSFAASSSFSSAGGFSDVDCRDHPRQSEVEEIPSYRWLTSPSPVPKPPRSEVDKVAKQVGDVHSSYRAEYADLKAKTERLEALLQEAARADLYDDRLTRRIMDDTLQVLEKAQALISKWSAHRLLKRVFTINPAAAAFKEMSAQLDDSIGDVSWLLRVSATHRHGDGGGDHDDDGYRGLPSIAFNEPILFLIWEQLAKLHNGSPDDRAEAAASLVSLARDNERNGKLIIEEGGVGPLLRLVKEGRVEGQEHAAEAIGLLGRDPESVDRMLAAGVCSVFAKVLKEGPMKAQAKVAWAVSEFAGNYPKCQDLFAQNNVIRLLVHHLAFETVQEHSKYAIIPTKVDHMSIHSVVLASYSAGISKQLYHNPQQQYFLTGGPTLKGREAEHPATKSYMKAMAAKALWQLARGNAAICKIITDSKALLCFAVLLEKGPDEVKYNSAMALMEISRMAEKDADLRLSAFKPNYPAAKAVVDQVLRIIEKGESSNLLLLPCVTAVGCLSRTFRASETRIIGPLVRLLDQQEEDHITRETVIALTKFACTENFLSFDHSKAIIAAGGPKHLVQLVYFGEQPVLQIEALVLLCYIAHRVPDDEALAQAGVLSVLEWASKQSFMVQDSAVEHLLAEAKGRCKVYEGVSLIVPHRFPQRRKE